jgi:hypothetical protein
MLYFWFASWCEYTFVFGSFHLRLRIVEHAKSMHAKSDGCVQTTESENISYHRYVTLMGVIVFADQSPLLV